MEFTPAVYAAVVVGAFGLFFVGSVYHGECFRRYAKQVGRLADETRAVWEEIKRANSQQGVPAGMTAGPIIKMRSDGQVEIDGLGDMSPEARAAFRDAVAATLAELRKSDS